MTEPDSGSDAFSLRTTATADGTGFVLRGRKAFITNAPIADVLLIFARTPGTEGGFGVTGYLVEMGTPGLTIESTTDKLGLRTSPMADVVLDDVRVEGDAVLGKPGRGPQIFAASMEWERSLIMASQLGALRRALETTVDYARTRQQFGRPIGDFESVSDKLADIHVSLEAARALLYETAWRYDNGARGASPAAGVKLFSAELVLRASLDLLQVHGGSGFTTDLDFERRLRDAVGGRIYSGTSEIMRRLVAKELGL
jgi:alkylation response protein AidB-like acyl-CoA dehydrogenase